MSSVYLDLDNARPKRRVAKGESPPTRRIQLDGGVEANLASPLQRGLAKIIDWFLSLLLAAALLVFFGLAIYRSTDFISAAPENTSEETTQTDDGAEGSKPDRIPGTDADGGLNVVGWTAVFAAWFIYETISRATRRSKVASYTVNAITRDTFGKRLVGIQELEVDTGRPLRMGVVWERWFVLALLGLLAVLLSRSNTPLGSTLAAAPAISLVPIFSTRFSQTWHDTSSGTVVVRVPDYSLWTTVKKFCNRVLCRPTSG